MALAAGSSLADTDIRASIRERSLSSMITLARLFALNQEVIAGLQIIIDNCNGSRHQHHHRIKTHGGGMGCVSMMIYKKI